MWGDPFATTQPNYPAVTHPKTPGSIFGSQTAPFPTNTWDKNLYLDTTTQRVATHPYQLQAQAGGLYICYPVYTVTSTAITTGFLRNVTFESVETIASKVNTARNHMFSNQKWSVDSTHYMQAPIVKGMPYVTMVYNNLTPLIKTQHAILSVNGSGTPGAVTGTKFKIVLNNGQTWLLYAQSAITLTWSNTGGWQLVASAAYTGYLRFALLDDPTKETSWDTYSTKYPTGWSMNVVFDDDNHKATMTYTWSTAGSGNLLMFALPHFLDMFETSPTQPNVSLTSLKGKCQGVVGSTWTLIEQLPTIGWDSPTAPDSQYIQDIKDALNAESIAAPTETDPYGFGKAIARLGRLAILADYYELTSLAATIRTNMKTYIAPWLNHTNSNALKYDQTWGGICSTDGLANQNADYGQGYYNDHHFHYGYFAFAAAAIAKGDSVWATANASKVLDLIRDYANPSASDPYFTQFRNKDFFDFHSWADGIKAESGDANNQESSSEAINAYYGMYLWGLATNDSYMRDVGRLLLAMEIRATKLYYHIRQPDTVYPAPFNANGIVGIVWATKADYANFFDPLPEATHGIQMIPITPIMELSLTPGWVKQEYPIISPVLTRSSPVISDQWRGFLIADQAVIDKAAAWAAAQTLPSYDAGNSKSNLLDWIARRPVINKLYTGPLVPLLGNTNIVTDPGFESGVSNWTSSSSTLSSSTAAFHGGAKSMLMVCQNSSSGAYFQENSVAAGTKRIFRIWVRGDGSSAGKFVQLKITSLANSAYQLSAPVKLDATTWKELWCTFVVPATGNVKYEIQGFDTVNNDNVYIDDAIITTYTTPTVSVSNRRILYNGKKVFLRGSNFQNGATGQPGGTDYSYEKKQLRYDLEDLKAQGVNMIRLYTDQNTPISERWWMLDECYRNGIGVMLLDFHNIYNNDFTQATGTTNRNAFITDFQNMVTNFKNHPAVIAYGSGSETNFTLLAPNTQQDWYTLLDAMCVAGKAIDNTRLYYTSNGEAGFAAYDSLVPHLDVWGITIYRGTSIQGVNATIVGATTKAAIFTEIGLQCFDASIAQNQTNQSNNDVSLLRQSELMTDALSGTTYFQMMDDRGDNQQYGIAEVLSTGSAQTRTKRTAWSGIQTYYSATSVYDYYSDVPIEGPVLWLKADDGALVFDTVGNLVYAWADKSDYGDQAIQYNPANSPTLVPNVLNGHPVVRFDASGRYMDLNNIATGPNVTVFIVAANTRSIDNNNNFGGMFQGGLGAVDVILAACPGGNQPGKTGLNMSTFNYFANQKQRQVLADQPGSGGSFTLYRNGNTSPLTLDYKEFAILTYAGQKVQYNTTMKLGLFTDSSFNSKNDVAEIIIYNRILSASERAEVIASLNTKYDISSYEEIDGDDVKPNFQFIKHQSAPLPIWNNKQRPFPVNDWYTNAVVGQYTYPDGSHTSDTIKQLPYSIKCYPKRLECCYPTRTVTNLQIAEVYSANLAFNAVETITNELRTAGDKFSLSRKWLVDSTHYMTSDIVRGSPYITMNYTGLTPKITTDSNISSINGSSSSPVTGTKFKIVLASGQTWILYSSQSITLTWTSSSKTLTAGALLTGYIRAALLPSAGDEAILDTHKNAIPTGTTMSKSVGETSATYTFTYATTGSGPLLMMALPHHMDIMQSPTTVSTQYQVIKGLMTGVVGSSWTLVEPALPPVTWRAAQPMDRKKRGKVAAALAEDYTFTPSPEGTYTDGDVYFYGKEFCKMAQLALIADELGDITKRDHILNNLKTALNKWLLSENNNPLRYDEVWGGLITHKGAQYPYDDFTQGWYSDHIIHYGQFVLAAAVIAKFDTDWYNTYKNYVNDLVRDYMNGDPNDPYYPVYREKDFFEGNSWLSGMFDFAAGKNLESTSEVIQGDFGAYLWGIVSGNNTLRDDARLLMAMDIRSAIKYWHIKSSDTIYPSPFKENGVVGIGWSGQVDFRVFFEQSPQGTHIEWYFGIQTLQWNQLTQYYLDAPWVTEALSKVQTALDRRATAHAIVSGGQIRQIVVDEGGTFADSKGYTTNPSVTIAPPAGQTLCGNLLVNPSAETNTAWIAGGSSGSITVGSSEQAYEGSKSIKQVQNGGPATAFVYQDVPVQAGQVIKFSAYVKVTAITQGGLGIFLKPTNYAFTYAESTKLTQVGDWTRISGSWTVPQGVTVVRLILDGLENGTANSYTAFWDAMMFEASDTLNPYCPVPFNDDIQATAIATYIQSQGGALAIAVANGGSGYVDTCGNMIRNPSAEDSTGWTKGGVTGNVTFPSSEQAFDGTKSIKVIQQNGNCFAYQDIAVVPGQVIQFSASAKITNYTNGGLYISIKPSNFAFNYAQSNVLTGVNDWTRISGSFTVPPGVTSVRFILDNYNSANLTGFWDAVMFEVADSANPYCAYTPAPTDPAITIDPAITDAWRGFIIMLQALIDPEAAWNNALTLTGYDNGNSKTNTLHHIAVLSEQQRLGLKRVGRNVVKRRSSPKSGIITTMR